MVAKTEICHEYSRLKAGGDADWTSDAVGNQGTASSMTDQDTVLWDAG